MSQEDSCALGCVQANCMDIPTKREAWSCKKTCVRNCDAIKKQRETAVDNVVTAIVEHENTADLLAPRNNGGTLSTLNGIFGGLSSLLSQAKNLGDRFASQYQETTGRHYVTDVTQYYTTPNPSPTVCAALAENIRAAIIAANNTTTPTPTIPKVCDYMDGTFMNCDAAVVQGLRDQLVAFEEEEANVKCLIGGIKFQILLHEKMLETCTIELNNMNSQCNSATGTCGIAPQPAPSCGCAAPPPPPAPSCGCGV